MKLSYRISSLLAAGLLMLSCGQGGETEAKDYFEVNPKTLSVEALGGQDYVSVSSSEDWLMRSDKSWAKVMTASGKASQAPLKASIVFEANPDNVVRQAILSVKTLSGKSAEVKVTQAAKGDGPVAERGIASADDLVAFAKAVNEGTSLSPFMDNGVIVLLADIDASSIKEWIPAGTKESPFKGTFDGRDHSITNISWTVDASKYEGIGIIGYGEGAKVRNLKVGAEGDRITIKGACSAIDAGGVAGHMLGGSVTYCTNNADIIYSASGSGENVCVAGICGRLMTSSGEGVANCTNNGDVICAAVCRAAGFTAYNEGQVKNNVNSGCILANRSGEIGPAWACSYLSTPASFASNTGKGHVGDYDTFKDKPQEADSDAYLNAVASPAKEGYDMAEAIIDMTKESYYNWTEIKSAEVSSGLRYTQYSCNNVPRMVNILEVDLSNPSIEITTSFADDCVPNPNGNKNSNNGYNIRETLSQLCERKRSEGHDIVAGINTGFFDSNDGITRGFHIEEGEPVYINNPDVVSRLVNHSWGFTVFTDGTASCGKKKFSGKIKVGSDEFAWCSANDTIMRHTSKAYQINLYDSHYKQYPHPQKKSLVNALAPDALYVIAEYDGEPMKVNKGYASAKVVSIADGRSAKLEELPYITEDNQIGIALSGAKADEFASRVSVGTALELRCDISIEGETTRPIHTQNSTMYHIMKDGQDNMASVGSTSSLHTTHDPLTFPVVSKDGRKVWLVEVDGRQGWYSTGITGYELYRIAKKLGGYNATRFDGGGSSTMWVYDSATGKGGVVNSVSDSKGERSCMNYILLRRK